MGDFFYLCRAKRTSKCMRSSGRSAAKARTLPRRLIDRSAHPTCPVPKVDLCRKSTWSTCPDIHCSRRHSCGFMAATTQP